MSVPPAFIPDWVKSTVTVTPSQVAANGTSVATVTAKLVNALGEQLSSVQMHLAPAVSDSSSNRVAPSGVGSFTVSSTQVGTATYTINVARPRPTQTSSHSPPSTSRPITITFYRPKATGKARPPAPTATAAKPAGSGWFATAQRFEGQIGKLYSYVCPENGSENPVWGTTTYTDTSSVCTAAVNDGLITVQTGGAVTIELQRGLPSYTGSKRNGTTSQSTGSWSGSFAFIGRPVYSSTVGYGGGGDWTAGGDSYRGQNGQRFFYICPPSGSPSNVWGTGTYTDDSSVCTAAVQAGLITLAHGGDVTIQIEPGASSYSGSTKNGITSNDYGPWTGSYILVTPTTTG